MLGEPSRFMPAPRPVMRPPPPAGTHTPLRNLQVNPVADHNDPRPSSGENVAREARAAEAQVSPGTMGRAEQIAAGAGNLCRLLLMRMGQNHGLGCGYSIDPPL